MDSPRDAQSRFLISHRGAWILLAAGILLVVTAALLVLYSRMHRLYLGAVAMSASFDGKRLILHNPQAVSTEMLVDVADIPREQLAGKVVLGFYAPLVAVQVRAWRLTAAVPPALSATNDERFNLLLRPVDLPLVIDGRNMTGRDYALFEFTADGSARSLPAPEVELLSVQFDP